MDLFFIFFLIMLNGVFAMSEMAVVSSRKARLQRLVNKKRPGASIAYALHAEPAIFLSTIQIGITSVGVLMGAIGENMFIEPLSGWLAGFSLLSAYSHGIALTLIVVFITYFSVVLGELVPKRLALLAPEKVATFFARPMHGLSLAAKPLVWILSTSSTLILKLLRATRKHEPPITNEEIKVLMEQGAEAGIFHKSEREIVSNVLRLDEQPAGAIMTPRKDLFFIDLEDSESEIKQQIADSPFARIIVCKDGLKHILGVLQTSDLLKHVLSKEGPLNLANCLRTPLYVLETMTITQLLEHFRKARTQFALIIDEYGELLGIVTLTDVLTTIVGNLPAENLPDDVEAVQREDGSWLIDGAISIERFKSLFNIHRLPEDDEGNFHTLAGFVLQHLGRIPNTADFFECKGLRIEIVDMDKHRVDKLLVTKMVDEDNPENK